MISLLKAFAAGTFRPEGSVYIFSTNGLQEMGEGANLVQTYSFNTAQFLLQNGRKQSRTSLMSRFYVSKIKKIDSGEFLSTFVYFEAISLHLVCLKEAENIEQYFRLQQTIDKTQLYDRLKLLRDHHLSSTNKSTISKLINLLEIRNQIAHVLKPAFIKYDGQYYKNDEADFVKKVCEIMWNSMTILVDVYSEEQKKLNGWLESMNNITPHQVILKQVDGKSVIEFGHVSQKGSKK